MLDHVDVWVVALWYVLSSFCQVIPFVAGCISISQHARLLIIAGKQSKSYQLATHSAFFQSTTYIYSSAV